MIKGEKKEKEKEKTGITIACFWHKCEQSGEKKYALARLLTSFYLASLGNDFCHDQK